MTKYKQQISGWRLVPSGGGKFEISLGGKLIFSKLAEGRFPTNEEVIGLIDKELVAAN